MKFYKKINFLISWISHRNFNRDKLILKQECIKIILSIYHCPPKKSRKWPPNKVPFMLKEKGVSQTLKWVESYWKAAMEQCKMCKALGCVVYVEYRPHHTHFPLFFLCLGTPTPHDFQVSFLSNIPLSCPQSLNIPTLF